ncbi:MAG: hypothetical protein EXR21_00745 [Flavobacteriaceae bacterium]|nr:hypothetical protein [Flavobacteriaceae bacterium]
MKKSIYTLSALLLLAVIACNRHKVVPNEIYTTWDRARLSTAIDDERFIFFIDNKFLEMRKGVNDVIWSENLLTGPEPKFKISGDSLYMYEDVNAQGNEFFVKKHKIDRLTSTELKIDGVLYNAVK